MGAREIEAGGAVVRVRADIEQFGETLGKAEARMKAFAAAALAIGAQMTGFGIGLGVGLFGAVKSFAGIGSEMDKVQAKLKTVDRNSAEFATLTKEAQRLSGILGGEDVQAAVKLTKSFAGLKDAITGIVVKFGAVIGPAAGKIVDYFTTAAKAVTDFIGRNRALAPQATVIVTALTATGVAVGSLGAAFFAAGPVIRLAMIGSSAAVLAFRGIAFVTATAVSVLSAGMKVAAGAFSIAAIAVRGLTTALFFNSIVLKTIGVTLSITLGVLKFVTVTIAGQVAIWGLMKLGLIGVAGALNTVIKLSRLYTLAQVGAQVATALFWTAFIGGSVAMALALSNIGLGLGAIGVKLLGLDQLATYIFTSMSDIAVSAFGGVTSAGQALPGALAGYFSDVYDMAAGMFNGVVSIGTQAFASAKELFFDLLGTAKQAFRGISDAIEAGNIQLAVDVLWAGIKIAWLQGTSAIKTIWATSLLYIEAALDNIGSNLRLIWDVTCIYLEGAFDKSMNYIRNTMQDATTWFAQALGALDPSGFFGDEESIKEEDKSQRDVINKGKETNEADRIKRLANAGVDPDSAARQKRRSDDLAALPGESPEVTRLKAELGVLVAQAAAEKAKVVAEAGAKGLPGVAVAAATGKTMESAAAQARDSSGAAGSIARQANSQLNDGEKVVFELKNLAKKLDAQTKSLKAIADKPAVQVIEED